MTANTEARTCAEAIVSTIRTALVVLDRHLRVASANDCFYETFRVTRSETEGLALYELGDRQWDHPRLRLLLERVFEGDVVTDFAVEHEFERIGWRVMRLDARLMRQLDRSPSILLTFEDCSERVTTTRLSEKRMNQLIDERRRKDQFLAILGHELRNPLSALMHGLELLPVESSPVKEVRAMMMRQALRIGSMLDQLLDIARLAAGKLLMARLAVGVKEVVQGAVEAVTLIETRRQTLTVSMPPDGNVTVLGDLMRLTRVVENLLSNAAKYTPEGGSIDLAVEADDAVVRLTVRDDGIGMDAAFVPHVFELFVQEPNKLGHPAGSLGLGLALVKSAVEMHGGRVVASSAGRGKGSEFMVTLPRLRDPRPERPAPPSCLDAGLSSRVRRILVVDDEKDAADTLAEVLARRGHEARVALDGPAAVEAARTFEPDVVLLDLGLPRMDGYEVARRLREQPSGAKVFLVALTGYQQDAEDIRQAGFDRHMMKPPDMRRLLGLLDSCTRSGQPSEREPAIAASAAAPALDAF